MFCIIGSINVLVDTYRAHIFTVLCDDKCNCLCAYLSRYISVCVFYLHRIDPMKLIGQLISFVVCLFLSICLQNKSLINHILPFSILLYHIDASSNHSNVFTYFGVDLFIFCIPWFLLLVLYPWDWVNKIMHTLGLLKL